jgi:hypothetical protein
MNNIFNADFKEFIQALNIHKVEYVLVGGYSVILHGYHRVTGDLDVYINPTENNYILLMHAFLTFGLPTDAITKQEFLNSSEIDVFTFGRPPTAIDIMTKLAEFEFDEVFKSASWIDCESVLVKLIHLNHLRAAKIFAGRFKDLDDLENLKKD